MGLRVLYLGEIVGKAGVYCVKTALAGLRSERNIDAVVANADGATGGFGLGKNHSIYLRKLGIDVLTGGDQIYYKRDMVTHIESAPYILRPANYPPGTPGRGWRYYSFGERKLAVISLLGQSGFDRVHLSNPFTYLPEIVSRVKSEAATILLDFHAATTAEKYTMFFYAAGTVSAICGSGQRVMTADAAIMEGGTAVICDAGRTGSRQSVAGLEPDGEIRQFISAIPERSGEAWLALELQGVIVDFGDDGRATAIEPLRVTCPDPPPSERGN